MGTDLKFKAFLTCVLPYYWNFSLKNQGSDQHYLMGFPSLFMSTSATCHAQHDLTKIHTEFICIRQSNQFSIVFLIGFQTKYFWTNVKGEAVIHEKIHKITCLKGRSMHLIHSSLLTCITEYFIDVYERVLGKNESEILIL